MSGYSSAYSSAYQQDRSGVRNFKAVVENGTVYCSWDTDRYYSFLYVDMEAIALPEGVKAWSGAYVKGAVYQAVSAYTASPVPSPTNLVPYRYITISWADVADTVKYEINIDGGIKYLTSGQGLYSVKSKRLESGVRTFGVIAIDSAGNRSTIKTLTYEIEEVPNPVRGIILSQSDLSKLTVDITPPDGW